MVSPSLTLLRTQSDERLIVLARAGHERAFDAIVERYRRPLLRHGRRVLGEARAEEAVQQAFLAAWAALQRGDEVRHLSGWLHRIVHNAALNALRGERDDWAELREWLEGAGAPEDELERREMLRSTLANLAALPERQREALLRIAVDGQSAEEVGGALGLSEGAVRQLLYRARTALRAAATALTPMPVAGWLARAEPLTDRLAEAAAGAGSAGLGSILAKTGAVVVVAGTVAATPVVLDDDGPRKADRRADAPRAEQTATPRAPTRRIAAPTDAPGSTTRASTGAPTRESAGERSRSRGSDNSGPGSDSSGSGSSGSGSGDSDNSGPGSGSSGSGSSGTGSSGSGSSGSGSSGSGSSGSGSGDTDNSGPGSLSSGSGSSGSASSGSGSSGSVSSGSSGSGSSGSGSSGSGSDDSDNSGSGSGSDDSDNSGSGSDDSD